MNKITLASIILLVCGCKSSSTTNDNETFNTFKHRFINAYWKMNPTAATSAGFHDYDSLLPAYTESYRNDVRSFCKLYADSLQMFKDNDLDEGNRLDKSMIGNTLQSQLFYLDTFKAWQWDPSVYNVGSALAEIVQANNLSREERMERVSQRLLRVGDYYRAAIQNISDPTPGHLQLAIEQSQGTLAYLDDELTRFFLNDQLPAGEKFPAILAARAGVSNFINRLTELRAGPGYETTIPVNKRDFRIGTALYNRKFDLDIQSVGSAEQIYQKAVERKRELHTQMAGITSQLWAKYFKEPQPRDTLRAIQQLIQKISLKHVHRDSFLQSIEQQIPELTAFVTQKNLLYLDPKKPLKVRKTPAYMDGVAGASISAPGPYDKDAETYYNVSTLEKMSAAAAESYLREYNHYVLQVLNIHEAIPGHYAQLVYSNQSPSIIKSVFGNGAMVEGWAVYSERMMLENGYGNNEPEMQLMYSKWHLRSVCNTILDYSVHVLGMSEQQALDLLMNQAFQQEAEARGKWRRVSLTQVQLCSYFSGYSEIFELRERLKQKPGFDLKTFHEKLLSYGSAPVREIAKLMEN